MGQVPGMNWAIPMAPAGETMVGSKPDSWYSCAASRDGVSSGHMCPYFCMRAASAAGTVPVAMLPSAWTEELPSATPIVPTATAPMRRKGVATTATPATTALRIRVRPPAPRIGSDHRIKRRLDVWRSRNQESDTLGLLKLPP